MGRSYKVNVMATSCLELNHDGCELVEGTGAPVPINTDIVILTEYALEVTVGEKYGS